ncbi:DUF6161 domain-containing protein [Bradyrhizobium sp. Leo121]|uniref:DUF6161 domain-containing protein n=1 Tax=Bradyrhizobium sp. Leo121 TaxID=1571195 RepID=UPI001029729B|nr:DUF6161 domain-containing protein [Bradyrhizobium sp. Leo121]RZN36003.1 hypothetical protein CWO90_02135 [Bradyrhizobium sp. Leo121]
MGSWKVVIPRQGVRFYGDTRKVTEFLNNEIAYFTKLAINGINLNFGGQGYGSLRLSERATSELSKIAADVAAEKTETLEQYINDANSRQILVGASPAGERVGQLKQESDVAAAILAAVYCPKWAQPSHSQGRELIAIFQSVAFANPANFAFDDLLSASETATQVKQANETSELAAKKLDAFIDEKTQLIAELENLYRKQLTIQEPAISWQSIAAPKTTVWRFWLSLFAFMVAAPIVAALIYWDAVASAIGKITATSNGGFSISGLAAISVPALFYAWLLKNISRVFIQNLNLADDADHRRSLALTYMGLLQDEKRPTSDQDRAIILNALFRPIPNHTADEGPPAGLIELMRK